MLIDIKIQWPPKKPDKHSGEGGEVGVRGEDAGRTEEESEGR